MIVATAVYHDGKLEPSEPLELEEGQEVRLQIESSSSPFQNPDSSDDEKKFFEQINAARSIKELFEIVNAAPPSIQAEGEGFDIEKVIDESRRLTGFRLPSKEAS